MVDNKLKIGLSFTLVSPHPALLLAHGRHIGEQVSDTLGGYRMVVLPANLVEGKEKYPRAEGPSYSELSSSHILQRAGQ